MDKPFQTYDDISDAATCAPRLAALRAELAKRGLDGFVVPHCRRAYGRISARPCRAAGLAHRLHRLGRRGGGADGQGGGVRRWPLHAAGARPDRHHRCSSRAIWWRKGRKAGFPIICRRAPSWVTTPGCTPPAWRGASAGRGGESRRHAGRLRHQSHRRGVDRPARAADQRRPCRMPSIWRASRAKPSACAWPKT